jgi:hypothetical protein
MFIYAIDAIIIFSQTQTLKEAVTETATKVVLEMET